MPTKCGDGHTIMDDKVDAKFLASAVESYAQTIGELHEQHQESLRLAVLLRDLPPAIRRIVNGAGYKALNESPGQTLERMEVVDWNLKRIGILAKYIRSGGLGLGMMGKSTKVNLGINSTREKRVSVWQVMSIRGWLKSPLGGLSIIAHCLYMRSMASHKTAPQSVLT